MKRNLKTLALAFLLALILGSASYGAGAFMVSETKPEPSTVSVPNQHRPSTEIDWSDMP